MWKRSSKCEGGHCVEVEQETRHGLVFMRNNVDPKREIVVTKAEWKAFVAGVKAGEFD